MPQLNWIQPRTAFIDFLHGALCKADYRSIWHWGSLTEVNTSWDSLWLINLNTHSQVDLVSEIASHEQSSWGYINDACLSVSCMPQWVSHKAASMRYTSVWGWLIQCRIQLTLRCASPIYPNEVCSCEAISLSLLEDRDFNDFFCVRIMRHLPKWGCLNEVCLIANAILSHKPH